MNNTEHGSIHPYVLVLKGESNNYRWNILKPDGTLYYCHSKAIAFKIAKSWAKKYRTLRAHRKIANYAYMHSS